MKKYKLFFLIGLGLLIHILPGCSSKPKPITTPVSVPSTAISEPETKSSAVDIGDSQDSQNQENDRVITEEEVSPDDIAEKPEPTPAGILEEALEAYQDAQSAWDKADIETAIAALDEAYSLILKLDLNPDSPLFQEKNDLRLLITQRIQEIYASHLIAVGENHRAIPLTENEYVNAEIKRFQTVERQYFLDAHRRSGLYRDMIMEKLKNAGLPEELSWIPIIESGFKVKAYSRARALGLWQFISSTAYRFGLKRNRWIDERMDPEKSTDAAIQYLKELHSIFGDWTTALASYNCGEFRIQRVIQAQRVNYLDNFWDLFVMLPRETARFVPRFIATLLIIKNPEKYGMPLSTPDTVLSYETVMINQPLRLSSLSGNLNLEAAVLETLNPELRHEATPDGEFQLKVPPGYGERVKAAITALPKWIPPEATTSIHYVRRGETVSGIARRYGVSASTIARMNHLRRNFLIRPGQKLQIPTGSGPILSQSPRRLTPIRDKEQLFYEVRQGDSLYSIARSFNTTVDRIKIYNDLRSNVISVGQKLMIQPLKMDGSVLYTVLAGDTLYTIANQFRMKLKTLLSINSLHKRSRIFPGQQLRVVPENKK